MRVFAYEHITAGGATGRSLSEALWAEARAIRDALVADLRECDSVTSVEAAGGEPTAFDRALARADAAWIVAPETGGILESLSKAVAARGKVLLSSLPEAIRVTSSKRRTAAVLSAAGLRVIPVWAPGEGQAQPCVAKPDDGCGCQETRRFTHAEAAWQWAGAQPDPARFVVQPYLEGESLSLSAITDGSRAELVAVNRQHITLQGDRFRYEGVTAAAEADTSGQFAAVAGRIVRALPGLRGYFGADLIRDREGIAVVEVNARLTSSYPAFKEVTGSNVAARVLAMLREARVLP